MKTLLSIVAAGVMTATSAQAATVAFTSLTDFNAALDSAATVIDTSANVGKTTSQLSDDTPGVTFFGPSSFVRSDGLIVNGQFFHGATTPHVGMNFNTAVNAVSVFTNAFDGGRILIYSGANGTGDLLGEAAFGTPSASNLFGGIIADRLIGSVIFTCDFNFDLACGLIDPSFGLASSFLASDAVPLPAGAWLFLTGAAGIAAARRRHQS